MISNLDRYKADLAALLSKGDILHLAMQSEYLGDRFNQELKKVGKNKAAEILKILPSFSDGYEAWYSEAKVLIRQLLPDRLEDFTRHYEKPKSRKELTYESYRIADSLQGIHVTSGWQKEKVVGPDGAIPHFRQQLAILKAVQARFESSLFDIRQLVQADLFDSELDTAEELAKNRFVRAAGAVAGVVLEKHLSQVCDNHALRITKKSPTISTLNDALKEGAVIEVASWRFIQHLGDIRNLCDHAKAEPTKEQVEDLISGVKKVTKTLF